MFYRDLYSKKMDLIYNKETYKKMLEIRRTRELKKLPLLYLLFSFIK